MNLLAKVKSKNRYNYITDRLYNESTDEETQVVTIESISDIEGDTALLTTNGTSWQLIDGNWVRIEQDLDVRILECIYPFISSVCQNIHNSFMQYETINIYNNIIVSYKDDKHDKIIIDNIADVNLSKDDFIIITKDNVNYLTKIIEYENNILEVDNIGVGLRVTGKEESIAISLVMFPPTFLSTVLDMLGYDMFIRDAKEKRQERLGNYTYTNFEPTAYNGEGTYPKELENAIKYWQRVYI